MKKFLAVSLTALALALPMVGQAATGDSCIAANGESCRVVAGPESDSVVVEGTDVVSGRGSWIAAGEWTITIWHTNDCSGTPFRVISSDDANNVVEGVAGSNNGGVYFGLCAEASTGPGGVVTLGAIASELLP